MRGLVVDPSSKSCVEAGREVGLKGIGAGGQRVDRLGAGSETAGEQSGLWVVVGSIKARELVGGPEVEEG